MAEDLPTPIQQQPVSDAEIVAARKATKYGATSILQLESGIAWRQFLKPASFRTARFYVDTGVREGGRRVVNHEFPKRDVNYAEDMGRKSREFTVRGYCIVYPHDGPDDLKKKNYIPARDKLITELETEGPANLQLPLLGVMQVVVQRYRVTEEDKLGGYCTFDMTFVEFGQAPATGTRQSPAGVAYAAQSLGISTQEFMTAMLKGINDGSPVVPPEIISA